MKKLGYIVTDKKIRGIEKFIEQVDDIELIEDGMPALIVGWEKAKKHSGYKSVIEKSLGNNIYWTFSKTESRCDFEEDLCKFYDIILNNILNNIKYYYINIFKLKYNKIKKLYNIIFSTENRNIYISNNMIYVLYDNSILGLSLDVLSYCRINPDKIISKIKSIGNIRVYDDSDNEVLKLSIKLGNKKYALPYFM